jgi:hypothetical protein
VSRFGRIAIFSVLIYYFAQFTDAQAKPAERPATPSRDATNSEGDLKMTIIGNGKLRNGHDMAVRIYEAPDGSKGEVTYTTLPSVEDAQKQIDEWVTLADKVTSREHDQKRGATLIGDRILGSRELIPKDPTKTPKATEFLIIRRDGANCYFIESLSPTTAMKVEDLIQHNVTLPPLVQHLP